ncbi:hypothetical protein FHU38_004879 [Saccharomonospora amisosensis]|uniref:YbaB/EbfC DNA-binding family protein n=1 Tax=Saccharomonospora amisosensis TaxID=1128677 RepID=A0A7X5UUL1_9PSEU|nr:YbaB/EbfC family nucleoid-associated protein [Saccharomonospora amisosensis]NIJ14478.1 hypothetical protein [Saccharomonospora amisosensis]
MEFREESVDPVFQDVLDQIQQMAESVPDTQRRMMELTGVAWSDDRMVKVVVGPRGQLVDLQIDPRVFRRPDASELQAKILATAHAAVADVTEQLKEIMESQFPPEIAEIRQKYTPEWEDNFVDLLRSDAEIFAERKEQR